MKKHPLILTLALTVILLLPAGVFAAAKISIKTTVEKMEVVETEIGKDIRFVPTDSAMPGEILRFTLSFSNVGDEAATDVMINNPIPENADYLEGSATPFEGVAALFSIDAGDFFGAPTSLTYETKTRTAAQKST